VLAIYYRSVTILYISASVRDTHVLVNMQLGSSGVKKEMRNTVSNTGLIKVSVTARLRFCD